MQGLNLIWVFNPTSDKVLMCKRHKEPYIGLFNLVGGKIEENESGLTEAYRELLEETGIQPSHLIGELRHLMDFTYPIASEYVEVYVGRLVAPIPVSGDEMELIWLDINDDLFDMSRFAGEGNIGHVFEIVKLSCPDLM